MWRSLILASALALLVSMPMVPGAAATACPPTKPDMLGPFYTPNAPQRSRTGEGLTVHGAVRSTRECKPLPGATLEWWSANPKGDYDDGHRATQVTDAQGGFRYVTDMPGRYPGRPVHLHVKVTAPGHRALVTQLYPKAGPREMAFDFVLEPGS